MAQAEGAKVAEGAPGGGSALTPGLCHPGSQAGGAPRPLSRPSAPRVASNPRGRILAQPGSFAPRVFLTGLVTNSSGGSGRRPADAAANRH